ncbi:hypothetical protein GF380_01015 [Candidatus Uhrbacteria bacterium]|nr:hypothetical protein [Candidatus Uhrbacteria bacterium]MBD3283901.1 hypothetical protein [Candidatus Uhrbacteria bacterium]
MPAPIPPRRPLPSVPRTAHQDTLMAISRHVRGMTGKINRMSASQQRILAALKDEPPQGVSRLDWIAKKLNEG